MVVSMKNRREFLKIFGMVTAAGAALTTVGVVAKAAPGLIDAETCVKTPKMIKTFHSPVKKYVDIDPKWLGGPKDTVEGWRNVWANLSGVETEAIKEAKERDFKMYGRGITPTLQERMVDNVFKSSPLFEYLKTTQHIDTDNTLTFTTTDAGVVKTTSGTAANAIGDSINRDIYDGMEAGAYNKTWETFKGDK